MNNNAHTVICVGTPLDLRTSRELVLRSSGYDVSSMDPADALDVLGERAFDVMVISVTVSEEERARLCHAAPQQTRIVQLSDFTEPQVLLKLIQQRLS